MEGAPGSGMMVDREPPARQPAAGRVRRGGTPPGLYEGRPLTVRSVFEAVAAPDRIVIFPGPDGRLARSPQHLRQLVADTVWHEIAPYFGMNERNAG